MLKKIGRFGRLFSVGALLFASSLSIAADKEWQSAIANDNVTQLSQLLADQPDVTISDSANRTALMIAAKYAKVNLFETLLERGANPEAQTKRGGNTLMFAVLGKNMQIINRLIKLNISVDSAADNGWSALTVAAAKGYVDVLAVLIPHSKKLNQQDIYGWTPTMRAVDNGHLEAVDILIRNKNTNLNVQNEVGETVLHRAAENTNKAMLELLLAHNVDKRAKDVRGRTASDILKNNGQLELLELL